MTLALTATLAAFLVAVVLSFRWPRLAWLAGALLGANAALLLLSGRVKAGAVVVVLAAVWLFVSVDRRPGGAR